MKILSRIAIGAALVMLVASAQPAQAACGAPYLVDATTPTGETSFVIGNPDWCGLYGCYGVTALSPNFQAYFWGLGVGNPALGTGDDNGGFPAQGNWIYQYVYAPGTAYEYGYQPRIAGIGGAGTLSWQSSPDIDGCVMNAGATPGIDLTECTCLVISDEFDFDFGGPLGPQPTGFMAVISAVTNASGKFDISNAGAPYTLQPIPKADVTGAIRNASTFDIDTLSVTVPAVDGLYEKDGCNCVAGYKVYGKLLARGSQPPTDRDVTGWTLLNLDGGGAQDLTPIGAPVDLELVGQCATNQDLYLGVTIAMDSGYETSFVSRDSTRIECGPDLADPASIRPRGTGAPELRQNPRGAKRGR